jgi:hypothetical protein
MQKNVITLTNWLNTFDEELITRLRAKKFTHQPVGLDMFEIKNNLVKIWIRQGTYLISFNSGWSCISTFNQNHNWVEMIQQHIKEHKIALLLSILPQNQITDYSSLLKTWTNKFFKSPAMTWADLTEVEVVDVLLPYIQKTKQDLRDGHRNSEFLTTQLKELSEELVKIKSVPHLSNLIALLET